MFFKKIWGFEQVRGQRVGKGIAGIIVGCFVAIVWAAGCTRIREGWKGIDLVSLLDNRGSWEMEGRLDRVLLIGCLSGNTGLHIRLLQASDHRCQVHPTAGDELPAEVDGGVEYLADPAGLDGRNTVHRAAGDRFESAERLVWGHRQPDKVVAR